MDDEHRYFAYLKIRHFAHSEIYRNVVYACPSAGVRELRSFVALSAFVILNATKDLESVGVRQTPAVPATVPLIPALQPQRYMYLCIELPRRGPRIDHPPGLILIKCSVFVKPPHTYSQIVSSPFAHFWG